MTALVRAVLGVRVVWTDELSKLWPLDVSCTLSEECGRQTQGVDHREQATPLMLPALLGATQTGGIVKHSAGEGHPLSPHHVPQLI